jgi:hypothetical protein
MKRLVLWAVVAGAGLLLWSQVPEIRRYIKAATM